MEGTGSRGAEEAATVIDAWDAVPFEQGLEQNQLLNPRGQFEIVVKNEVRDQKQVWKHSGK